MEKPQKMPQIYGYLVCLVTVITVIICIATLVGAILDLGDPIHAGFVPSASLSSYDNYRMEVLKSAPRRGETIEATYIPDEKTIRGMYEAAREDKIQQIRHNSHRTIIVDSILIVVSTILFVTHWRWMRRLAKGETIPS